MEKLSNELAYRFRQVEENLKVIQNNISDAAISSGRCVSDIKLLAATKTVPSEVINHVISLGIDCIGENKVQELISKYNTLDLTNCEIHMIGHLQTNKVKQIVGKVNMIQSVDSVRLANEIAKVSLQKSIETDILAEVNIGMETSKSGVDPNELEEFVCQLSEIRGIKVRGIMSIPPICEKKSDIRRMFSQIYRFFIDIRCKKVDNINMDYLSMGMSSDYTEAILEGANIVRIGSLLFGNRIYT